VTAPKSETVVELRVRYSETDQMGVAYHAHYLAWCELARTEHMRRLGVRYRDLEDRGLRLAVSEVWLRYARPARYDDLVRVSAWLAEVGSRRVVFGYRIERADDGLTLATAQTALVSLDAGSRPSRIPEDALKIMKEWCASSGRG
jgi:acyl-CoA thioester hydrolase